MVTLKKSIVKRSELLFTYVFCSEGAVSIFGDGHDKNGKDDKELMAKLYQQIE